MLLIVIELSVSSEPKRLWSLHSLPLLSLECSYLIRGPRKSPLFWCPHCMELHQTALAFSKVSLGRLHQSNPCLFEMSRFYRVSHWA